MHIKYEKSYVCLDLQKQWRYMFSGRGMGGQMREPVGWFFQGSTFVRVTQGFTVLKSKHLDQELSKLNPSDHVDIHHGLMLIMA